MAEHGLPTRPTVVLNAPEVARGSNRVGTHIRAACGLDPEIPLLTYSGAAAPQRGLATVIEALAMMPDVHVALVVPAPNRLTS